MSATVIPWPLRRSQPSTLPATPAARLPRSNADPFGGIQVFERGWLSSNNVLLHGHGEGAVLVDSAHCLHGAQTVALIDAALAAAARDERPAEPLAAIINTHLHSDHCGGNAALQRQWPGLPVFVPSPSWASVTAWDEARLSYRATGQKMERFAASGTVHPGETLGIGKRQWQVLAAPGHDPESVILFDDEHGVLISADALWENGFGVVFPELDGIDAFDEVAATLDLIESLDARWVVPGHGRCFGDVPDALQRARRRLAGLRADPHKHRRHAAKVLLKYHLLEEQRQTLSALQLWAGSAPLIRNLWEDLGRPTGSLHGWCEEVIGELVTSGAARRDERWVVNV